MPPALVVTNPDKPAGRTQRLTPPPVKLAAERRGIPVLQPGSLKTARLPDGPWDFFVVAAYGKILPPEALALPRLGTINVHPSLLPRYRGPAPVQSALLAGDRQTGVTLILLDNEVDHGPILAQQELTVGRDDDYGSLSIKLTELGANMLADVLPEFMTGKIAPVPQDHDRATFTKKITAQDAFVPFADLERAASGGDPEGAARINRMIRAFNPEPGAWTMTPDAPRLELPKNRRVRLLKSAVTERGLVLKTIQTEGQKPRQT